MSDEASDMTTWRCTWQSLPDGGFRVWVIDDASLAAEGETFAEADEALADLLLDRRGDTDGIREYSPPQPVPASEILAATPLVVLSGESLASRTNPAELFDGGLCPECKRWRGNRTEVPLKLASIRSGVDAATAVSRESIGPNLTVVSESFLELLTAEERDRFELRPVEREGGRKKFFELIQGTPLVPVVGIRGVDDGLWRCGTCGYAGAPWYGRVLPDMPMSYVSEEDIGVDGLTVFALDERQGPVPALQASRWSELAGEKGTRGIRSYPLGVLRAHYVDRDPPRKRRADTIRRAP